MRQPGEQVGRDTMGERRRPPLPSGHAPFWPVTIRNPIYLFIFPANRNWDRKPLLLVDPRPNGRASFLPFFFLMLLRFPEARQSSCSSTALPIQRPSFHPYPSKPNPPRP